MYSHMAALAASIFLVLGGAAPAAAKEARKIAITPASPKAAIVIKAPVLPVAPGYQTSYRIGLQRYDHVNQSMEGRLFSGTVFAAKPHSFVDGYLVEELEPGTYAFQYLSQQDHWALCFNGGSRYFTVKPGEIVYLGEMNVRLHVAELQRLAIQNHRTSSRGEPIHFFDTVTPPTLAPVDEADLEAVAAMVRTRMPGSTVAPRKATFGEAKFGTGHNLFGLSRICGGYYQGKAKQKKDAE